MAKSKGCARHGRKRKCMCKKGKRLVFAKPSRCGGKHRGKFHYEFSSDLEKCSRVNNKSGKKTPAADKHCVRSHTIKSRRRARTWPPTV
jgi:hypothetical protein